MPLVRIVPKTLRVEDALDARMGEVRERISKAIRDLTGYGEDDVFVSLEECRFRNPDPKLAELVLYAETCPSEVFEPLADAVRDKIAMELADMGFSSGFGAEVWPQVIPGSWCLVRDGKIVESDDHLLRLAAWASSQTKG